jgi:hypothetical protein
VTPVKIAFAKADPKIERAARSTLRAANKAAPGRECGRRDAHRGALERSLRMILSEKSATPAFAGASFFGIMR